MREKITALCLILLMSGVFGCNRVKTYTVQEERVDQELNSGNRGYLSGQAPAVDETKRKKTRDNYTVEINLPPYSDSKPKKRISPQSEVIAVEAEPVVVESQMNKELQNSIQQTETSVKELSFTEYKVEANDTLQRIAKKFYGSNKDWYKIYEVNKDILGSPDKIKPGQILKIPK